MKIKSGKTDYEEPTTLSAGEKIREFLDSKYYQAEDFINTLDDDLQMDGKLAEAAYNSTLNYSLRRIISLAHYFHRSFSNYGDGRVRNELRRFLLSNTRYDVKEVDMLMPLLIESVKNSEDDFSDSDKRKVKQQIEKYNWGCFICGRTMDTAQTYLHPTADHKWPRALGGESIIENLRYACSDCNNKYKKDFLDYSDFHYEHITFVVENYGEYISKAKNRSYEAAIFAKSDYCCVVCSQPAYRVGELYIGRNNPKDNFHFFNLSGYCQNHNPEK